MWKISFLLALMQFCSAIILHTRDHNQEDRSNPIVFHKMAKLCYRQWNQIKLLNSAKINYTYNETSEPLPRDCAEATAYNRRSGLYEVQLERDEKKITVVCSEKDDGGWTVVQRRVNGNVDFHRNYFEYQNGFGEYYGNYWLGLHNLYILESDPKVPQQLKVVLQVHDDIITIAKYDSFQIGDADEGYALQSLGKFHGSLAGDALRPCLGNKFLTYDKPSSAGAWWHNNSYQSNLNGIYKKGSGSKGLSWNTFRNQYSLKFSEILVRPAIIQKYSIQ